MNRQDRVRHILGTASEAERVLDAYTMDNDMDVDKLLGTGAEIQDLYRQGFDLAQEVSASFFEEMALLHGFSTPIGRAVHSLEREAGKDIEDLYPTRSEGLGW